jgi:hypothetical protein
MALHPSLDRHQDWSPAVPADLQGLQVKIQKYQDTLDQWGLRDYQVNAIDIPFTKLLYTFSHGLVVWFLASLPSLVLNAPVGMAARYWAAAEARKDLKVFAIPFPPTFYSYVLFCKFVGLNECLLYIML